MEEEEKYPDRINSKISLTRPNEIIDIHQGEVLLRIDEKDITLRNARVFFTWYPHLGMIVETQGEMFTLEEFKVLLALEGTLEVRINDLLVGRGFISALSADESYSLKIKMINEAVIGDKSITCSEVYFMLPNFRDFLGESIRVNSESGVQLIKGRIVLDNEKYQIILDKFHELPKREKEVRASGGHLISYDGLLKRIDEKPISHNDLDKILPKLASFLSFINGFEVYPMILQGVHEDEIMWTDYSQRHLQQYQSVKTWTNRFAIDGFNQMWRKFSKYWDNENCRDVFNSAIKWYNQINRKGQYLESSIIISQTVLELLYNWWVVEKKKGIVGKDSENISAGNKIRLLLSFSGYDDHMPPPSFQYLQGFISSAQEGKDALEAIVNIRNSIVHSQEGKRKELKKVSQRTRMEALDLSIWYIEYLLLHFLDYDGQVVRRIDERSYIS